MKKLLLALAFSVATSGAFASGLGVSFEWGPTKKCFDPKSPPIALSGVPQGTTKLQITMTDSSSAYNHGGGTVAYKGQTALQYGAFRYKGPCPDSGTHFYNISVKALDASGKVLATGSASQPFSAK
ncbi:phospholipid-binding protein [Mesorhizobium sp. C416B]|uniref:phospholipid-binding protein n=1 Tax=unclassified Mesorhizobium TaxID=325217 RepID=UPI000A02438D|nr:MULTISPECIES: phospholipid-binding protein [unclassified Mesorhizobium]WJI64498.1 phospholipid-binding protein [Mesorhizobium sp. C416B]